MLKKPLKKDWLLAIEKLNSYSKNKNITVNFSKNFTDISFLKERLINLDSKHKPEILCYIFLHELGHILLAENQRKYKKRHSVLFKRAKWTQVYRMGVVEEEIEAWNVGLLLSRRLKLPLNQKKFEQIKANAISEYAIWANIRKHPHKKYSKKKKTI